MFQQHLMALPGFQAHRATRTHYVRTISGGVSRMIKEKDYGILVVDDEPTNARLLACMLRDRYVVREAYSGAEALQIARSDDKPALILLDVMMPDIDGFEVCRQLKTQNETKDITVIFVTTLSESAAEEIGLNLGAVDYLTKPVRMPIMRARVRNHMNLRKQADMLEALSYIDGLTHVYNRRRFDAALLAEWQRGRRLSRPLAIVMIDFDHFKALNDHYGHGTGDACLQQGATALATSLRRPTDLLARYGGEEFVALLPDTNLAGACVMAETMRQAIKALRLRHEYSPTAGHVTISLGVASMTPTAACEARQLLQLADRALNRAKIEGRDRIGVARLDDATETTQPDGASNGQTGLDGNLSARLQILSTATPTALDRSVPDNRPPPEPVDIVWLANDRQRALHELANLMLTNLEQLLDTSLNPDQDRFASAIQASVNSLRTLLDDAPVTHAPPDASTMSTPAADGDPGRLD